MLKIKKGEPWIMWPDRVVSNFIDFPANHIFEYSGNYSFRLLFGLPNIIEQKSTLFAKLPTYFGLDLEPQGMTFIITDVEKQSKYLYSGFNWEVGKIYDLEILKNENLLNVYIDSSIIYQEILPKKIGGDTNSHIIFGSGNFPHNGFNLNYLSVNLIELKILKDNELICSHNFENIIHNKCVDSTNNCNFIHKI